MVECPSSSVYPEILIQRYTARYRPQHVAMHINPGPGTSRGRRARDRARRGKLGELTRRRSMAHQHSNQEYADVALRTLYGQDIGAKVKRVSDLVHLAGHGLDGVGEEVLMNIVGSRAGLLG